MFEFKNPTKFDELSRSDFANLVCKLLVDNCEGSLDRALDKIEPFYENFFEHVRNIYEEVQDEIPLFALYELLKYEKDNWDFTEEEYQEALERTRDACTEYYLKIIC